MRIRTTVAAVSGALVLSGFAVPAAQAADAPSGKAAFSATAADGVSAAATLDVTFSDMKVNKGKPIVVGATSTVSVPVTYTVTHAAGLDTSPDNFANGPLIYKGSSVQSPDNVIISEDPGTCTAASTTVLACSAAIKIYAGDGDLSSTEAGTWHAGGLAVTKAGDTKVQGDLGSVKVLRTAKLTVDAAPEPVKKGRTLTVTGKLTRANWDTNRYAGYSTQPVVLQFRKAGTTTYTDVKGIKSSSTGTLKTTTTATVDGYYRFVFAGSATTAPVNATGDYVDVQ
ncbi:hypothetical protein OG985_25475 [Streptomyces sp. NBC_00289]|uniref:hypothetical protein n=1 Tax=Streptomyces sp. NBC_00289 TaxID=2975703 RepID=UPI003250409C